MNSNNMNISGSTFYTKLRELIPSLPSSINPEVLSKLCEDDSVQPFIKWFTDSISLSNILSDECILLREHIQKNDTWLQGEELDLALAKATKDSPELLKLIETDYWDNNQSITDFDNEKELYDPDYEYLQALEASLTKLKECEEMLDNNLDKETDALEKVDIEEKVIYDNCITVLEDFDSHHRQLSTALELLSSTYIDAVQKKGESCLWTQMPIELYTKQLKTYNDYLNVYASRQFLASEDSNHEDYSNHSSFSSESSENESLICYQKNLLKSKLHEIIAKVEENASNSLVNYVIEIYNNGNLKAPSTPVLARAEIAELTKRRDFLEENVNLLQERQLVDIVQHYSKAKVMKVLEEEAEARLQRRNDRLLKLEKLSTLAKEHGHAFSTLLCMLFELQIHRINEIVQFVLDARYYLSKEYSLSSERNESMQKLQNEYSSILVIPKNQNAFNQTFVEMASVDDPKEDLLASKRYYDEMKIDNSYKLKNLLDEKIITAVANTKNFETKVMELYEKVITSGPTLSFKAVPCHIQDEIDKTLKQIEKLELNVESIRNKLKTVIKETGVPDFEREKLLLWQKFLADPESLKKRYEELEAIRNQLPSNL